MAELNSGLAAILRRHEARLLADWMSELAKAGRTGAIDKAELEEETRTFVRLLAEAAQADAPEDVGGSAGGPLREMLATLSASRARQGFTSSSRRTR
jgi:rsbT co-antagonist protein RsbR